MMGMKRCLAGLLAGVMLFPGIAAVAEETDSTVKIQESLVSREETEDTSLRERLFQIAAGLLLRESFRHHLADADVNQVVHIAVGKRSVGIAPPAVVLIDRAVFFPAENRVLQRHPAALADQLPRRAEQGIDRHVEQAGKQLQRLGAGDRVPVFPPGNRLPGHKNFRSQFVLGQSPFGPQIKQHIFRRHQNHLRIDCDPIIVCSGPADKQPVVAPSGFHSARNVVSRLTAAAVFAVYFAVIVGHLQK